jgi:hypothetical protein
MGTRACRALQHCQHGYSTALEGVPYHPLHGDENDDDHPAPYYPLCARRGLDENTGCGESLSDGS